MPEVYALHPVQQTVDRVELIDGEVVHRNALGMHSEAMQMAFTMVGERLGVCCPGGRVVTLDDDPFGWLVQERSRADAERERAEVERERAEAERERADNAEARAAQLQAELDRLRAGS